MKGRLYKFIIFFLLCGLISIDAQIKDAKKIKILEDRISENYKLFNSKPEVALYEIDELINEASTEGRDTLELHLLSVRCEYYYLYNEDFTQMLSSAQLLQQRAQYFKNNLYQAKANTHIAKAYNFNKLYKRSVEELQKGLDILDKDNPENSEIITEKANIYIEYANFYSFKEEFFNALRSLKHAADEHDKLKDPEKRRISKFIDYANIAGCYWEINDLDSAEYYAQQSLKLKKGDESHNQTFINYLVLGNVNKRRADYPQALKYYQLAESIKDNKFHLNVEELYKSFMETYDSLGMYDLKTKYEVLLKDLQLQVAKNKNESLVKILEQEKESKTINDPNNYSQILLIILILILSLGIFLLIKTKFFPKHKNFAYKEKDTFEDEIYNLKSKSTYHKTTAFLDNFELEFPDFTQKLLQSNPDLSLNEIELLAMLKLNLSSKEIADQKNMHFRSVENQRYKLRKKLSISPSISLQDWLKDI